MKKKACLAILVCLLMSICACGKTGSNGLPKSGSNMLPTRIEKINEGGNIPEGFEAVVPVDNVPEYPMLWGEWVLDVEDSNSANPTDKSIKMELEGETNYIECLPYKLEFSASWASGSEDGEVSSPDGLTSKNMNLEKMGSSLFYGKPLKNEKPVWNVDLLGRFAENNGYGYGIAKYREEESKKTNKKKEYVEPVFRHEREVIYSLVGDKLAIGLTEIYADEIPIETDILEIDYDIDFSGYKMTLSYGSESATYIPSQMVSTYSEGGMSIDFGGPIADEYVLDNIEGICINKYSPNSNSVLFDNVHDGYVKAKVDYSDDGIISIQTEDGKSLEYEYKYSGMSLSLIEGEKRGVYSAYTYKLPSQNNKPVYSFNMGENAVVMPSSFSELLDLGFSTEFNNNQSIMPGTVTDEIALNWNSSCIKVKLCNPYNISIPAYDCEVCYMLFDDSSGAISKGDGLVINETTYDWVSFLYEPPFEKTDQSLRYKAGTNWIVRMPDWEDIVNTPARLYDSGDIEIAYDFKDKILKDVRIEKPSLLYAGLQDNVDRSLLEAMEPETFSGVIQVRDTILDRLRESFEQNNVDVSINEATGEIVMANEVLFGFDEDTLSDEGKEYIDKFIGAYASVLTADEINRYISQISFEGHTDSTGTYTYNLGLSQRRAEAVMNYCIDSNANGLSDAQKSKLKGLSTAIGYAFTDPVFDNQGNEDPEASRRAAIKFFVNIAEDSIDLSSDLSAESRDYTDSSIDPKAIVLGMEGYGQDAIMILAYDQFHTTEYEYDNDNKVNRGLDYSLKTDASDYFNVAYDVDGYIDRISFGEYCVCKYDSGGKIINQGRYDKSGKIHYCDLEYQYDSNGKLNKQTLIWKDSNTSDKLGELGSVSYKYGDDGRMSGADFIWDGSLSYRAEYEYTNDEKTRIEKIYFGETDTMVGKYECQYHGSNNGMIDRKTFTYENRYIYFYDGVSQKLQSAVLAAEKPLIMPDDIFHESNREFLGWSDDQDATKPDYDVEQKIEADDIAAFTDGKSNKILYGVWK